MMQYSLALLALVAAVQASPVAIPQGVTAVITPTNGPAPPGCTANYAGTFGIAAMNISTHTAPAKRQVTEASDGQPQATPMATIAHVSQITDGQIQGGYHTVPVMPIGQISDGQPQASVTVAPVTEYHDGQPQVPTVVPVTEKTEGQPNIPPTTSSPAPPPVSASSQSQPQAPASSPSPQPSGSGPAMVACATNGTLELTLNGGILKDSHGRTGYIASNFQFQFDDPPQAGAIITAGFSVCTNGSLALGGSAVFYQCLSGDFYNLYNTDWAAQCSPVTIQVLQLINCS